MKGISVKVEEGGKVAIPAEYRKALGVGEGDDLIFHMQNGKIVLLTRAQAILYVQEQLSKYNAGGKQPPDGNAGECRKGAERD